MDFPLLEIRTICPRFHRSGTRPRFQAAAELLLESESEDAQDQGQRPPEDTIRSRCRAHGYQTPDGRCRTSSGSAGRIVSTTRSSIGGSRHALQHDATRPPPQMPVQTLEELSPGLRIGLPDGSLEMHRHLPVDLVELTLPRRIAVASSAGPRKAATSRVALASQLGDLVTPAIRGPPRGLPSPGHSGVAHRRHCIPEPFCLPIDVRNRSDRSFRPGRGDGIRHQAIMLQALERPPARRSATLQAERGVLPWGGGNIEYDVELIA